MKFLPQTLKRRWKQEPSAIIYMAAKPAPIDRVVSFLIHNPGASSVDVARACRTLRVSRRVSDARKAGYHIETIRSRGITRYWLMERRGEIKVDESELIA